jgi:hypothetical protein
MNVGQNCGYIFYQMENQEEKNEDLKYMDEASAPAAVTIYQI